LYKLLNKFNLLYDSKLCQEAMALLYGSNYMNYWDLKLQYNYKNYGKQHKNWKI